MSAPTITAMCLLFFIGCMGKSAQIPLYVWLPDAMAGPTPVSALIHAATMVTSGIYLVARLNFLYTLSPVALEVVATVGALTAFFAATIAVAQKDIKKVLAYSTVSQLGYMFLACGVGAFSIGVFHVITHAFFKALLFLGAGSVIHGMHEEQDIWKMGGLRFKMPKTFLTFGIGWLAICGIPPLSGFFSKDEILWRAFSSPQGSTLLWGLGTLTAVMTAFYMTRLFSLTFLGELRTTHSKENGHGHGVHESPPTMVIPLQILAGLSVVGGFIGIPHWSWLEHWLEPVIPEHEALAASVNSGMEWVLMGVSVLGAALGIGIALSLYRDLKKIKELENQFSFLHRLLENKWYVDEIYQVVLVKPIQKLCFFLWKQFDVAFLDRIIVGLGRVSVWTGETIRLIQTGSLQFYALILLFGLAAATGYLIYG
jgi:NADH-quinone oxidoreductase subunit L